MAQEAGLRYYGATTADYGACLTSASAACVSPTGNTYGNYGCFNAGNKRDPFPCMIGEPDTSTPAYGFSTSTDLLQCSESSCEAFAAGFNDTVPILASLFVVMIVIVGAARIARFAGEDG